MAWVWELAGAVRGRKKDRHKCRRAGLKSCGTDYCSSREPQCVCCAQYWGRSQLVSRVSTGEQSQAVNIQEGAALAGSCTQWSIICKHLHGPDQGLSNPELGPCQTTHMDWGLPQPAPWSIVGTQRLCPWFSQEWKQNALHVFLVCFWDEVMCFVGFCGPLHLDFLELHSWNKFVYFLQNQENKKQDCLQRLS